MNGATKNAKGGFGHWGMGFGDPESLIRGALLPKPETPYLEPETLTPDSRPATPYPLPPCAGGGDRGEGGFGIRKIALWSEDRCSNPKSEIRNPKWVRTAVVIAAALLISLAAPVPSGWAALSVEAKQAVEKGLDYLAKTQGSDGSWPDHYGKSPAVVGLAALAFMAHGDMPGRGKYKDTLEKAIDYILKHSQENGLIARTGSQPMYDHGFATLALAEAYGMSKRKDVEVALLRAVRLVERVQNERGGWRYQPRAADDDITVTGCQLMALRAARNSGVNVQSIVIRKGLDYIKSCVCADGGFAYQPGGSSGKARTGIGILLLQLLGESESPLVGKGAEYLSQGPLRPGETYYYYGLYYCTQAMFQKGGEHWQSWRKTVLDTVVSTQNADGSWPKQGSEGGDTYAVAMALLALEVEWKLLPIYQR